MALSDAFFSCVKIFFHPFSLIKYFLVVSLCVRYIHINKYVDTRTFTNCIDDCVPSPDAICAWHNSLS